MAKAKEKLPKYNPIEIRDISESVYCIRLEQDCPGNVARMIEEDEDTGERLRTRAAIYDPLTRVYLDVLSERPFPIKS